MPADSLVPALIGFLLLFVAWRCWTGRWRGWANVAALPAMAIAGAPGIGAMLVLIGVGSLLPAPGRGIAFGGALLASLAGIVITMWDPGWYGPRWYRERDREYDLSVPLNAAMAASVQSDLGAAASEAVARAQMGGHEPAARWRAHLVSDAHGRPSGMQRKGLVRGHVLLYPGALLFAADAGEDRMRGAPVVVAIGAAEMISAERVPPRTQADGARRPVVDLPTAVRSCVRVDTHAGAHVFEIGSAARRARDLQARYHLAGGRVGSAT